MIIVVICSENIPLEVDKKDIFGYYISIMNEKFLLSTEIINLSNKTQRLSKGCVVAVGSFDGIHKGHATLLSELVNQSNRFDLPSVVFSFATDDGAKQSPLLADKNQKSALLKKFGVDFLVIGNFSKFRDVSAQSFANDFLFGELGAKTIICGYDFRFGKGREGSVELLKNLFAYKGVEIHVPDVVTYDNAPISSSAIRNLIAEGDVKKAFDMLGRYYSFSAEIVHGAHLGNKLGFPTINQNFPASMVKPKFGVYAVYVKLDGAVHMGVANFGIKPTVGGTEPVCETHLFDFSGDCYGKTAEISFVEFLREEKKFSSLEALKEQVERDKENALSVLF